MSLLVGDYVIRKLQQQLRNSLGASLCAKKSGLELSNSCDPARFDLAFGAISETFREMYYTTMAPPRDSLKNTTGNCTER